MLKIADVSTEFDVTEQIAPEVFIDSVYVYDKSVKVNFHLEDNENLWLNNQVLLNNILLKISYDSQVYQISLSALKTISLDGNKLINFVIFDKLSAISSVEAYCGNEEVTGPKTTQPILLNDAIVQAKFEENIYTYINKIFDLRILTWEVRAVEQPNPEKNIYVNRFYVTHTTNKQAKIGFIFDLESFLDNASPVYRYFKYFNDFKNIILQKTILDIENIAFYKKNVSREFREYEKIVNNIETLKFDDASHKYLLSINDDTVDKSTRDQYKLKINIPVKDFSRQFFKEYLVNKVEKSKQYLTLYKAKFNNMLNNKNISNIYEFIYKYEFENEQEGVTNVIEDLSSIYSFYSSREKAVYYSLFLSIFHPLTTNIELLDLLLENISKLQSNTEKVLAYIESLSDVYEPYVVDSAIEFVKESAGDDSIQTIDYNYDINYGYEVIHPDNFENRSNESIVGFKKLTNAEKTNRKTLELNKFAGATTTQIQNFTPPSYFTTYATDQQFGLSSNNTLFANNQTYFSFSSIDLGQNSVYLLENLNGIEANVFNDAFLSLNQHNKSDALIKYPESYYYGVLDNNVYVSTIDKNLNNGVNNLQQTTLFDPNLDSQQASLEFITSTGVEDLYFALDKNIYIEVPSTVKTINIPSGSNSVTEYINKTPSAKPRLIMMYNNFFEDIQIIGGLNYALFHIRPTLLNGLFSKKLKSFNDFYLVEYATNQALAAIEQPKDFINELNYNIPTKYLNRNTVPSQVLISLDDL